MATEVLRPQDCLAGRIRVSGPSVVYPRRNSGGKPRSVRKPADREVYRQKPAEPAQIRRKSPAKGLEMGKVKILRRGESLPEGLMDGFVTPKKPGKVAAAGASDDLLLCGVGRLGPEPASLPIFRSVPYAGTTCDTSPAPSDLPIPSFKKKTASRIGDDLISLGLKRLLRLDCI